MNLYQVTKALKQSWTRETSHTPKDWSENNPALGQCAISALVVNDYLGGGIVWAEVVQPDGTKVSHYFNLIDGQEVDLTRSQFPQGSHIPQGKEKKKEFGSTREYLLSNMDTKKRYSILKSRVQDVLSKEL